MFNFPNFVKTIDMVSVEEAFRRISEATDGLGIVEMELRNATGFVLAEDYISTLSFPPFDQSAMDGYAVNNKVDQREFRVVYELKAGDSASAITLRNGEACRIFTGAMLPNDTTAVVKQEDVVRVENTIQINRPVTHGENVRLCGEQINNGDVAVRANTVLNPGAIGFLSTLGVKNVKVFRKPKIAIIATGNELIKAGSKLEVGKIFESNTNTLISALSVYGFQATADVVEDSYDLIRQNIDQAINSNDLVLITGGISVGDYDFVGKILLDLNVEEKFYKVKQKPGKPLFFGVKGKTIVFALPGNPAAVLTSFYMYVLHALAGLTGRKTGYLTHKKVKLSTGFEKSPNLTFLLKGKVEKDHVTILPAQSSAMLSSFIEADCLIRLNENKAIWEKDELVDVYTIQ
jgi:molybdopterin molybdotransferase